MTMKQRREEENVRVPGGLRTPWKFVRGSSGARRVGARLALVIDCFLDEHPHVIGWLLEDGEAGREKLRCGPESVLVTRLAKVLGAHSTGLVSTLDGEVDW